MRGFAAGVVRTMPNWRAAWQCSPAGFVAFSPLSGLRALAAVGSVSASGDADANRAEMRSALTDRALVEGHDPVSLFHRVNAAVSASGVGRIDCLALLTRAGDGVQPAITGVGRPSPLVVTPDGLSTPVEATVSLAPGWAVVLGSLGDRPRPLEGLLTVADVSTALSLFSRPSIPGALFPARTLLAVLVDG